MVYMFWGGIWGEGGGYAPDSALGWDSCSWMSLSVMDTELGSRALYTTRLPGNVLCSICRGVRVRKRWFKDAEKGGKRRGGVGCGVGGGGGKMKPRRTAVLPLAHVSSLAFRLSVLGKVKDAPRVRSSDWKHRCRSAVPWGCGVFFWGGGKGADALFIHTRGEGGSGEGFTRCRV